MSVEERLAEIAARIVAFRTRDAKLDAARHLVESTGSASADEIEAALADWTPPEGQDLADLVARKCAAAIVVAEAEVERERGARAMQAEKAAKLRRQAEDADAEAARPVDDSGIAAAYELLTAAIAAGGDPARAPAGRNIAVTPMGAEG